MENFLDGTKEERYAKPSSRSLNTASTWGTGMRKDKRRRSSHIVKSSFC